MNNVKSEKMKLSEEAVTTANNNIQQDFKINIQNGKGVYEAGISNSFWSRLIITAKVVQPQNGSWTILIRDKANKNIIVYENHNILHDKDISFNYMTGLKTNLVIEATWTEAKNTILSGEISIEY
jgi:hypothetical protein